MAKIDAFFSVNIFKQIVCRESISSGTMNMAKKASRRPVVKTLSIVKSRDIVVDKLLKPCEDGAHSNCTGWAVLKKELSPINANYFLKCNCSCHRHLRHQKKEHQQQLKQVVNQVPIEKKKANENKKEKNQQKRISNSRRQKAKNQQKKSKSKKIFKVAKKRTRKTKTR